MSDTGGGGTPAAATPAADGAAATPQPADPTLRTGPRRAAPGLSGDRGGMTLTQGIAALRRGAPATPAATPAADGGEAEPTAPPEPRRRAAPTPPPTRQPVVDGQQRQQQQPAPTRTAQPASPLDAIMAAFLPGDGDGADPQPQRTTGADPQPAPVNQYIQGVPLTVEGQQRHFTVPELTDAVLKANDYTKKTQALSEQARALAERTQTIDQLLPILIPEIERQLAALNGADAEPDWIALAADPAEYARQNAAWRVRQQQRDGERQRLAQITQANQQREQQLRAERVRISHGELARTLPGWADAKTRDQLVSEMRTWGVQNGFPAAELDQIVEARHITTIAKAMCWDRMVASSRTRPLQVPQVRRGGAPEPPAPQALRTAQERFDANPTHKAGVGLLVAQRRAARANGAAR